MYVFFSLYRPYSRLIPDKVGDVSFPFQVYLSSLCEAGDDCVSYLCRL